MEILYMKILPYKSTAQEALAPTSLSLPSPQETKNHDPATKRLVSSQQNVLKHC